MMHHLDMDDMRLIDEILGQHLKGLVNEIAKADGRAFRDGLRERYDKVEALRQRLTAVPQPDIDARFH